MTAFLLPKLRSAWIKGRRAAGPGGWARRSWSQEAEDLIIDRLLEGRRNGFYVDVGSHHPFRFSNTYYFYRRGWRGICIDALPGSAKRFRRHRPRDIALETGVALEPGSLVYHLFNDPALNTFDAELASARERQSPYRITATRNIPVEPLAKLIAGNLPAGVTRIDLLSVDVEGLDLPVLQSNDWDRYRPEIVVAECLDADLSSLHADPVAAFIIGKDYLPYAKSGHSIIFRTNR